MCFTTLVYNAGEDTKDIQEDFMSLAFLEDQLIEHPTKLEDQIFLK